jgi:hypothetical protein
MSMGKEGSVMDENTFSLAEALAAQKALRDAAGAEEEVFDLSDVIGMVSEEIDMLKDQGKSYVPADERDQWDDEDDE